MFESQGAWSIPHCGVGGAELGYMSCHAGDKALGDSGAHIDQAEIVGSRPNS